MNNIDFNRFSKDGIIKVKNFLSLNENEEIKNIIKYYSLPKDHPESVFSSKNKHLIYKLLKFKFKKFSHHLKILKLVKKKGIK